MAWRGVATVLAAAVLVGSCVQPDHTVRTVSSSIPTTPTAPPASPVLGGGGGTTGETEFVSADGLYQMRTDPAWSHVPDTVLHVEYWYTGPSARTFRSNVNVLEQRAPGTTLADYIAISRRQFASLQMTGVQVSDIMLPGHTPGALIAYSGGLIGNGQLEFLAVVFITHGTAIVATYTAPKANFAASSATVEPYLRTLGPG